MNNNPFMNNLMQLMSMGQNPQQIVQNAIASNPQLQQAFSQIGSKNLSTKDIVLQIAQKRGIDLNPMIQYLQQTKGIKM
jgi:predicted DsbA family dithiol-disulfide isomerase